METLPLSLLLVTFFFQNLSGLHALSISGQCLKDQRLKLLQFKGSLEFDSSSSTKLVHWNPNSDCCSWSGVECDGSGHVISLELDNESIFNATEDWKSLFSLLHLERLSLAQNSFNSFEIPTEIESLTNLKYLNLSGAGFAGQIPIAVSRLKNLATLDLSSGFSYQFLKLENPDLGALLQNLGELDELYLDDINISARGSEWCNALSSLSKLRVLSLPGCSLSGPITSSLLQLKSLSVIRLDRNNLSTRVPDFFANFPNLTTLSLVYCNLQGQFPEKIFQVSTLQYLDLSSNLVLTGNLPQFPRSGSFKQIVLSDTKFSGSLPDSIRNLEVLSWIEMSNCSFSGPIPSTIGNLSALVYLDLSWNNFSGSIPSFQLSKNLAYIDLSHNGLRTLISSTHFQGLTNMVHLNLGYNYITGRIPPSLFALPALQKLQLSHNQFDGRLHELPSASASFLKTLDLSWNHLRGSIPKSFFKLERLVVLSLSFNTFSGILRLEEFKRLPNLTRLYLSNNNLSIDVTINKSTLFSLPQLTELELASCNLRNFPDLKNQSILSRLDLSSNYLTGEIPNWIWEVGDNDGGIVHLNLSFNFLQDLQKPYAMPDLLVLDLHSNLLQGEIPNPSPLSILVDYSSNRFNSSISPNIGYYISTAFFFSVSNNRIVGAIPESICNVSDLKVLDLSNNSLSGRIPSCLLKLDTLGVLNLGRNNLSGIIPDTLPKNSQLRTLDLSMNVLEGRIPRSLANCNFLQVLNVGNNKIEDRFPCILMKAKNLGDIVLRSNLFHGDLHCSWANHMWPSLQIMDIAYNNFSGALPLGLFLYWKGLMIEDNSQSSESTHLQFEVLTLSQLYYQDTVVLSIKGLELNLVKILRIYACIDFSSNNFRGKIPDVVGEFEALYVLNLSHNALIGTIPESIGNLTQLGSLDLSVNQLNGAIPVKLGSLTILSFLNLSFNRLSGKIPSGRQLQTFAETSFLGNAGLCGFPLNTSCNTSTVSLPFSPQSKEEIHWEYISAPLGFTFGLGIICWLNLFSSRWKKRLNFLVGSILIKILPQQQEVIRQVLGGERVYRNPIRRL